MADKKTVTIDSDLAAKLDTNGDGHISAEEMAMNLEASRLMVRHGARLLTQKDPSAKVYCAMAKKFATDHGFNIVNDAL